ncbi:MAG TPA: ABC transporter ATP-binding protein [Erysipelothrix sp.]|nr:ABC transporter ATP-binding protein [Erysipelothrix sp.]
MVKRLLSEVKEYKMASLLAPLFMAGEVITELMIPFLMGFIIDRGVYKQDLKAVFIYGGLMFLMAVLALIFGALSGHYAAYASNGFVKNLRKSMFESIQSFSFANIDKFSTSGLVTRMMTDAQNVQNAYQMSLRMLVRAPLMLIVAMFMTFYINSRLAIIFLVAAVFLGLVSVFFIKKVTPIFTEGFKKYDDLNASIQENVSNIRVVKAYVKEEDEKKKFFDAASSLRKTFRRAENYLVFNAPIMQLTMYASMIALSWFGAQFIVVGNMTTGELMSMFTYTMNILFSLMMISMIFVMLMMSGASAKRIVEVLDEKPSITNPENPIYKIPNGDIEFENVSFGYYEGKDKYVLNNIDLNIHSGETIGIIGSTGSSKTTLTSLIARLYDVSEGSVKVGGIDVREYDLETLRDGVAMVLQKNVLFSGTVLENLRWGNENATLEEVKEAAKLASAHDFIMEEEKGYDAPVEQGGTNFSGGQRQRLTIARALLKNPKVLILDDSTSAVDTKTDRDIREALKTTRPDITKLIISQRISSIEDADRILVLDKGVITGVGTHEELIKTNTLYQEVYETQKRGDE